MQWVFKLQSRQSFAVICPDHDQNISANEKCQSSDLEKEKEKDIADSSSISNSTLGWELPPKELEALSEMHSSRCRLFSYQEIQTATSHFSPGNPRNGNLLGWKDRYKVALGVAAALEHLHDAAAQPIIHRDVKSSNILLSSDFEPKLSDFGLAMLASSSSYHIDNRGVAGTFGYLAPEYFMHGKVINKIDVYAFGVVLLELLSGRKPIDNAHPKGPPESLVMWAKQVLKGGKFSDLLDPSLVNSYDHDQFERMVLAATLCIRRAPQFRPQISMVVKLLQGDLEVIKWAKQEVNTSDEVDAVDGEQSVTSIQSFINLALLNLEDDSLYSSSVEPTISVEDYLRGRCSRSSSFDQPPN